MQITSDNAVAIALGAFVRGASFIPFRAAGVQSSQILRCAAVLAFELMFLSGCYPSSKPANEFTFATAGDYPPWTFSKPDGSLTGYEIDLIRVLCTEIKFRCKVVSQNFDGIIPGLVLGRYDGVISAMSATEERMRVVEFSVPYAKAPIGFLTARASRAVRLPGSGATFDFANSGGAALDAVEELHSALRGKSIGVPMGTSFENFADKYFSDQNLVRYPSFAQIGLELTSGRIDVAVDNVTALKAIIEASSPGALVRTGPTFFGGVMGVGTMSIAFRPQDKSLRKKFNEAINSVNQNGVNKALTEKWFGVDISVHRANSTIPVQSAATTRSAPTHMDHAGE